MTAKKTRVAADLAAVMQRFTIKRLLSVAALTLLLSAPLTAQAEDQRLSPGEYKRIQQVQSLQVEARWQEAKKTIQGHLKSEPRPLLEAMLWRSLAQVELQEANYEAALPALKKAWQLEQLPEQEQLSLQGIIAQLMLQQEEYKQGIPLFEDWLSKTPVTEHKARHYLVLAQAYSQQEKWAKALPNAQKAVEMTAKVPTSWYKMLVGLHSRLEQWPQAIKVQKIVVGREADTMSQWRQLALLQYQSSLSSTKAANKASKQASSNKVRKADSVALATLRMAYERQLFNQHSDYQLLSQWLNANGLPYKAAQVLEQGLKQPTLQPSDQEQLTQQRRLAQLWIRAKALPQAEAVLHQLAKVQPEPQLLQQLAQLQIRQQQWHKAERSLKQLLAMSPNNYGEILLLHGITLVQLEERDKANQQFQLALKEDGSKQGAKQWLNYLAATAHSS